MRFALVEFLVNLLEDCSGRVETSRSLRGEIHPAGAAKKRDPITWQL